MSARIIVGYLALSAALGTGVLAAPGVAAPLRAAIGLLGAGAIGYGARRHAPLSRAPWRLLAAAVLAMTAGDVLYAAGDRTGGPVPALADACHLLVYPLVAAGLLGMTRSTVVLADRARMLDLLTFACAAALAAWVVVISPTLAADRLTGAEKSTLVGYALGDVLVAITVARLAVAARRTWASALLAIGACGLLAADVSYALAVLGDGWRPGNPAELGYLALYAGWGAAALHPSMTALTEPVDTWPIRLPGRNATLLAGSLAIPPVLLVIQSATGGVRDAVLIAVVSVVMLLLVVTRLGDAIGRYRRSLVRERALREACGALVAATGPGQVTVAVRAGVAALLPARTPYEMALVGPDDRLPAVAGDRRTRLIDTALLDPVLRDRLARPASRVAGTGAALICPLGVAGHPAEAGGLVVTGPRAALVTTRNAIEVLAAQAALALDRIALTDAMNRRADGRPPRTVDPEPADESDQRRAERELIRRTLEESPAGQNRQSSATKFR